ncbi:MAG TPA: enolase C-terminal domain-like protein [Terracidiphilus sp.]|nr:enolase C-terminal domain-like protein [Terracidiphilus sp.]
MKITNIRWTQAFVPIEAPLRYSLGSHPGFSRIIIEIDTDEGITGLGECYGGTSHIGQLEELRPHLIGMDPMNLERIRWKVATPSSLKLFGYVLGFAGIEFAILDIQGKALNMPVCDLIGGRVRDEVPFAAYLFYRYPNDEETGEVSNAEQMVSFAKDLIARYGFKSIKYKNGVMHPDEEVETFIALRKQFPQHRIRLDPNAVWTVTTALDVARKLHDYNMEYLEDPVWGMRAMARVNAKAPWITLASNMSVFAFEDLAPAVSENILDVVLLDPHWYGGITRAKVAGQVCDAMGIDSGMHSGAEFGISQAAMIHLAAASSNLTLALDSHYHHLTDDIIAGGKLRYENGSMRVPGGPGLGVSLDHDKLARYAELSQKRQMGAWTDDPRQPNRIITQPKW